MQSLTLKAKGRYSSVNELSAVPEGALIEADDVDILSDDIIEPRRGFERATVAYSDTTDRTDQVFFYGGKQFAHHGTYLSAGTLSYYDGSWTAIGSVTAPSGVRIHTAKSNQNLYVTTSAGIKTLSAYNGTLRAAGAYKALDVVASLHGSSGFLTDTYSVAYRVVWGYRDANNNLILGAPSARSVVQNNAGGAATRDVDIKTTIPSGVTTAWIYQVYRSAQTSATEPSDDLQLVYEASPTGGSYTSYSKTFAPADVNTGTETITIASHGFTNGDVVQFSSSSSLPTGLSASTDYFVIGVTTNTFQVAATYGGSAVNITATGSGTHTVAGAGVVAFTDITPDSLRAASLYTNASQEGLAYGNEAPPLAKDLAVFGSCLFFGNVTSKHRYYLTLIAAGGSTGLVANDTITIGGVTYTAKASEAIASAQFAVATLGTAAQNIKDTAQSLVRVINRYSGGAVYAYYLSGPDDTPGKILLEERGIGGNTFYVLSSRSTCWTPAGIPSAGTSQASSSDSFVNGLFWSKPSQPEAVPLVNFAFVGSRDSAILRIVPLKEALLIFKEDGIYRLTGGYQSFAIEVLDSSARLTGVETPAILSNRIFCLTDQGVVAVSDGVQVISRPIERDILAMFGADLDLVKNVAFGVAYETDRKYYLFMPDDAGDTAPVLAHVYNVFTQSWVRHILDKTCGIVDSNRLYLADADAPYISKERKSYSFLDYADYGAATTITVQSTDTLTLGSNVDIAAVGDVLYQASDAFAVITAVDTINSTVTVDAAPTFSLAAADILKSVPASVKWAPVTLANPGVMKHVHEALLLFKDSFYGTGYMSFETDLVSTESLVPIEGLGLAVWGLFPWGDEPWGGEPVRRPARTWIPRDKQICSQLIVGFQHSYAFSPWQLQGVSIVGEIGSERVAR